MPKATYFNLPQEKQDAVFEAALDEFAAFDFDSASIAGIVKKTGIARGSFYQYFEDKADLYGFVLEIVIKNRFDGLFPSEKMEALVEPENLAEWLKKGIAFDFANPRQNKVFHRAMFGNFSVREISKRCFQQTANRHIQWVVEQGILAGRIRPDVDITMLTYLLNLIMSDALTQIRPAENREGGAAGYLPIHPRDFSEVDNWTQKITDILENGIKPREES